MRFEIEPIPGICKTSDKEMKEMKKQIDIKEAITMGSNSIAKEWFREICIMNFLFRRRNNKG